MLDGEAVTVTGTGAAAALSAGVAKTATVAATAVKPATRNLRMFPSQVELLDALTWGFGPDALCFPFPVPHSGPVGVYFTLFSWSLRSAPSVPVQGFQPAGHGSCNPWCRCCLLPATGTPGICQRRCPPFPGCGSSRQQDSRCCGYGCGGVLVCRTAGRVHASWLDGVR